MLTREQLWRRLKPRRSKDRLRHQAEYEIFVAQAAAERKNSVQSIAPKVPRLLLAPPTDFSELKIKSIPGRKVRFSPVIRVCLVHCRADLLDDFDQLFWVREDYQTFKEDALRELRAHWLKNRTTVKEAINDLYQPAPDESVNPQTLLQYKDSVAQIGPSRDLELGLGGDMDIGADIDIIQSPNGSTSSTEEYSEERKQQQGTEKRPAKDIRLDLTRIASLSGMLSSTTDCFATELSYQKDEKQNGGLLCSIANGDADLITPLKTDNSKHNSATTGESVGSKPPTGILKRISSNTSSSNPSSSYKPPANSRTSTEESPARSSMTITIPTLSAPPPSLNWDMKTAAVSAGAGTAGTDAGTSPREGVRLILLEESPCSSVSSFEPPMLTC